VHKRWVENVVKQIPTTEDRTKVLFVLGPIMYSRAFPVDHDLVFVGATTNRNHGN
jgi:hypothetical protein